MSDFSKRKRNSDLKSNLSSKFDSQPSCSESNFHCIFVGVAFLTARIRNCSDLHYEHFWKVQSKRIANRCIDYNHRNVDSGKFGVYEFSSFCWSMRILRMVRICRNHWTCHFRTLPPLFDGWPCIRLGSNRLSFVYTFCNLSGSESDFVACDDRDYAEKGLKLISVNSTVNFHFYLMSTDKKLWILRLYLIVADIRIHSNRIVSANWRAYWTLWMGNILWIGVLLQWTFWNILCARNKREITRKNYATFGLIEEDANPPWMLSLWCER